MKKLRLDAIRTDGDTQLRAGLSLDTVGEYVDAINAGAIFPPLVVYNDGTTFWLADGFHRHAALVQAGREDYCVDVHSGDRRDALLYSASANAKHGLRRSNADKRRAVSTILTDTEWSQWSDRKIAKACGVTHPFVAALRAELRGNGYQPSDEVLAELHECLTGLRVALAEAARSLLLLHKNGRGQNHDDLGLICTEARGLCVSGFYWERWCALAMLPVSAADVLVADRMGRAA